MSSPSKRKLDRIRVTVLGAANSGKTALIVRYLTKRFIGEYERNKEYTYRQRLLIEDELVNMEILDTIFCEQENEELSLQTSCFKWADGIILLYNITDRRSFYQIPKIQDAILRYRGKNQVPPSIILVGNKTDFASESRQVGYDEAHKLALTYGIPFYEISVRESYEQVDLCFKVLISELRTNLTKKKNSRWPSFKSLRKRSVSYPE
ncbi:ras-related and estrogen-regulated growth inhibitor-like protein [Amphiura filiformis]|uniref:ras-related and estrogen-regulated growth inhibitor-like protein n=1 Tax=Amphiura filiformis TaxID=82378 RepID=UPI003B222EB2